MLSPAYVVYLTIFVMTIQANSIPTTTTTKAAPVEVTPYPGITCRPGEEPVQCQNNPCNHTVFGYCPLNPKAVCRPSNCGGCFSTWYLEGVRVYCFAY